MILSIRPRYVPAFAPAFSPTRAIARARSPMPRPTRTQVGVTSLCMDEATTCKGDRPAGSITRMGYGVLMTAPFLGAASTWLLFSSPWIGFALGFASAALLVFPSGSDFPFGFRNSVCCADGTWKEQL